MRDPAGRFVPGTSGNPGGRPRSRGLQHEIELELARQDGDTGRTKLERIAETIVRRALEGDLRACELLSRRLWPEKAALGEHASSPVEIRVVTGFDSGPPER